MATPTVQLNLRVPPGLIAVLDELATEAGQSRTRYIAQLVKNAQVRRDIELDVAWYRGKEPTEFAAQVARQGESSPLGVYAVGDVVGSDRLVDAGAEHPVTVVGAARVR